MSFHSCHGFRNRMLSHIRKKIYIPFRKLVPFLCECPLSSWSCQELFEGLGEQLVVWRSLTGSSGSFRRTFLFWTPCRCSVPLTCWSDVWIYLTKVSKTSERVFWRLKSKLLWQIIQYLFLIIAKEYFYVLYMLSVIHISHHVSTRLGLQQTVHGYRWAIIYCTCPKYSACIFGH